MSTGFLITTLSGKLKRISDIINQHLLQKLYIYVSVNKNQSNIRSNEWVSSKIFDMYSSSYKLFPNLDVRIILNGLKVQGEKITISSDYNVDVIILPKNFNSENISQFRDYLRNSYVVYVDGLLEEEEQIKVENSRIYNNVILGGSFDRLHTGHKILLSEAILRCSKKLTVGVTDEEMIKSKKLWELIEPCTKRISAVERFIKEIDRTISYEVVPINDIYGPTKSDPDLNMLVVSLETTKGGLKVNELRKSVGLQELDIHVVNLIEDVNNISDVEESKISSSNLRMRLLGTYIKEPEVKYDLPSKPYVIGLTGGVASGKSTICEYLKELGAAVIDCDKIGHQLYVPNSSIYFELIKVFGKEIVSENGEINRKVLGGIVFGDKEKLALLNKLMWPAIFEEVRKECKRLGAEDKKVVIVEAAVLIQAGWQKCVHEVWATIIPKEEAINRLKNRNNLTEEQAISRIESQLPNTKLVENANVVFCSLWSFEFTRSQVNKAWQSLQGPRKIIS